jgi:ABC-type transport system involved in multi-copper enzyme maturation permease subunit
MLAREVRILFGKEWRQLLRSRSALVTALVLPFILLVILPGVQILGTRAGLNQLGNLPSDAKLPPALAAAGQDPQALLRLMLLPLLALGGLIVPMVTASYSFLSEREGRTLELLVALPVRVGHILLAKLGAILALAGLVILVFFSLDAVLLLVLEVASPGYVLALLALLMGTLSFSTASALLVSLVARDFRTSNNVGGLLIGPATLVCLFCSMVVPNPTWAALLLATVFASGAVVATFIALKVVTFERLLR